MLAGRRWVITKCGRSLARAGLVFTRRGALLCRLGVAKTRLRVALAACFVFVLVASVMRAIATVVLMLVLVLMGVVVVVGVAVAVVGVHVSYVVRMVVTSAVRAWMVRVVVRVVGSRMRVRVRVGVRVVVVVVARRLVRSSSADCDLIVIVHGGRAIGAQLLDNAFARCVFGGGGHLWGGTGAKRRLLDLDPQILLFFLYLFFASRFFTLAFDVALTCCLSRFFCGLVFISWTDT